MPENEVGFLDNIQLNLGSDIDLRNREIFIYGDRESSNITLEDLEKVTKGLKFLQLLQLKEEITIYLTCNGGEDELGLAIFDAISLCECPIHIIAIGKCYSMGTVILQAANKRSAFPHTRFMIHEGHMSAGMSTYEAAKVDIGEMKVLLDSLYAIYENNTHLTRKKMRSLCKGGDYYFGATEAIELGFIDKVKDGDL
jgi:ATP-dependent Clp endopeptidase proteolytic subunit ClpP